MEHQILMEMILEVWKNRAKVVVLRNNPSTPSLMELDLRCIKYLMTRHIWNYLPLKLRWRSTFISKQLKVVQSYTSWHVRLVTVDGCLVIESTLDRFYIYSYIVHHTCGVESIVSKHENISLTLNALLLTNHYIDSKGSTPK